MRNPSRTALRPVKRLIIEPTPNKAAAVNATAATRAPSPRAKTNGARGTSAPAPNEKNEDSAAPQGRAELLGIEAEFFARQRVESELGIRDGALCEPVGVAHAQPARRIDQR